MSVSMIMTSPNYYTRRKLIIIILFYVYLQKIRLLSSVLSDPEPPHNDTSASFPTESQHHTLKKPRVYSCVVSAGQTGPWDADPWGLSGNAALPFFPWCLGRILSQAPVTFQFEPKPKAQFSHHSAEKHEPLILDVGSCQPCCLILHTIQGSYREMVELHISLL